MQEIFIACGAHDFQLDVSGYNVAFNITTLPYDSYLFANLNTGNLTKAEATRYINCFLNQTDPTLCLPHEDQVMIEHLKIEMDVPIQSQTCYQVWKIGLISFASSIALLLLIIVVAVVVIMLKR
jgi:hypothetical protein